jgi:hypothetical protein
MKTQKILLEVTYDENWSEEPARWNWPDLLDADSVSILEVDGNQVPDNKGNLVMD